MGVGGQASDVYHNVGGPVRKLVSSLTLKSRDDLRSQALGKGLRIYLRGFRSKRAGIRKTRQTKVFLVGSATNTSMRAARLKKDFVVETSPYEKSSTFPPRSPVLAHVT